VLHADGRADVVSSAASDIGTGTYTVMAQIAAAAWACRWRRGFQLGDSTPAGGADRRRLLARGHRGLGGGWGVREAARKLLELARALPHRRGQARFEEVEFAEQRCACGVARRHRAHAC
jgi:xanthine dehydrogenase YagR molybdenum-binding subunit